MSFTSDTYRVFIASPSDLEKEREAAARAIYTWNERHAEATKVVLLPVRWETHLMPQLCDRPQQAINDQLLSQCDILVGLFWTRLGTHTGVAESGTVEEIDCAGQAGKPCLLYFSDREVKPSAIKSEQLAALREFKTGAYRRAITGTFHSPEEIATLLERDLLRLIRSFKPSQTLTATGNGRPKVNACQLHHVSVAVSKLQRSVEFYRDVLSLTEIPRPPFAFDGAWFMLPSGQQLHLVERDRRYRAPHYRLNHFALRVPDFDAAYRWLEARWPVETYPTLPTGFPQAYVQDPDGNIIEINSDDTITHQHARACGNGTRGERKVYSGRK